MLLKSRRAACLLLSVLPVCGCDFNPQPEVSAHFPSETGPAAIIELQAGSAEFFATPAVYNEGAQTPPATAAIEPERTIVQDASPPSVSSAATSAAGLPDEGTPNKGTPFEPPFAARTDLFSPPANHVPLESGPTGVEAVSLPAAEVALMGFARVREPRVLLMIEESMVPLGVGEEQHGIRVVAIDPPQVTLARDDQQWNLSLSNQFSKNTAARTPHRNSLAD